MKRFLLYLIFIVLIIPLDIFGSIQFDLTFGSYMNDHYKHEFKAEERNWKIKNQVLTYSIDAHEKRYTDTLNLREQDVKVISSHIIKSRLNKNLNKDLSVDYLDKSQMYSIKGHITVDGQTYNIHLKANGLTVLYDHVIAKQFKDLEDILYAIIEFHK